MSSKLDKSLDEIASGQRRGGRGRAGRKGPAPATTGGVTKKTAGRPARAPRPSAPAAAAPPPRGDSKIIVSNLPDDVTEQQIKEYFTSTVGPVKRVLMSYTKTGRSTGQVTIIFAQSASAAKAAKDYDGVKVDNRPMKIEVVMGAQYVADVPAAKTLKDRIVGSKATAAKPKSAAPKKSGSAAAPGGTNGTAGAAGTAAGGKKGAKKGRAARRPNKTAEELDAEMADYFDPNAVANGTAAPATNGATDASAAPVAAESAMQEDEIM